MSKATHPNANTPQNSDSSGSRVGPHLWEITAVREALILLVIIGLLIAIYSGRAILAPIAVAFALAYCVDPVVSGMRHRFNWPRVAGVLILLLMMVGMLIVFSIWLMPRLVQQTTGLLESMPVYWETVRAYLTNQSLPDSVDVTLDPQAALNSIEPATVMQGAVQGLSGAVGIFSQALGTAGYAAMSSVLIPILFITFATYFDRLASSRNYLPQSQRERIWKMLKTVDAAFSAYIRGQLIVAVFTTLGFCIGFALIGVPYWFVVSLIGGALSLIPYGQVSGIVLAVLLKLAESLTGSAEFSWLGIFVAPLLVYLVTQSMETWVITPLVQGGATKLHPVIVIVALVIGGMLAGIVGLILAIPLTAAGRTIFNDLVRPPLKEWAANH